jgi:hypothetical protein
MKWTVTSSLAIIALAIPCFTAHAAGLYDGTWQISSGGFGTPTATAMEGTSCSPETLRFEVKDSQIHGSLEAVPGDPSRVEIGQGAGSAPLSGTVAADGTVTAHWENYTATGKITGDTIEMRWAAPCGPRVATGSRTK